MERRRFLRLASVASLGFLLRTSVKTEGQTFYEETSHCIAKNYGISPEKYASEINMVSLYKTDEQADMKIFSVATRPDNATQMKLWNNIINSFWNVGAHRQVWRGYESKYGGFDVPIEELKQVGLVEISRLGNEDKPDYIGFYSATSMPLEVYVFPWTWQNYAHPFAVNGKHFGIHPCGSGAIWIGEFKDIIKNFGGN